MTVSNETIIEECMEPSKNALSAESIYNFVSIDQIGQKEQGSFVDVIGVCKSASEVVAFIARASGKELKKREVVLVDQSNHEIALTIWGDEADSFDGNSNPVVVVRGARLSEFQGGKSLNVSNYPVKVELDIPAAHRLKGWWENTGKTATTTSISLRTGSGSGYGGTPWLTFRQISESQTMGTSAKGDYYRVNATVCIAKTDNMVYKACPTEGCNKKLIDQESGEFRCEKCNKNFTNYQHRIITTCLIADPYGCSWINMFNEGGEKLFGRTSNEVGEIVDSDDKERMETLTQSVTFKTGIFKCRAKMEVYNDESRLKTVMLNFEEEGDELADHLMNMIEKISGLHLKE